MRRRVRLLESLLDGDSFLAAVAELTLAALAQGMPDADAAGGRRGRGRGLAQRRRPVAELCRAERDDRRAAAAARHRRRRGRCPRPQGVRAHRARAGGRALCLARASRCARRRRCPDA